MGFFKKGSTGPGSMENDAHILALKAQDEARRQAAAAAAAAHAEELRTRAGTDFCSARGCKEETGVPCSYLDRRQRRCPTAWCVEHRVITHNDVFCPSHATLIQDTDNGFGLTANPDMENRVPMLVNWVTRELDTELRGMVEHVAREMKEAVVVEPMRFVLFGVERTRTWERSWKVVSHHGVSLRVAVAVEEARPNAVLGKMNSKIAVTLPPPWNEEYPFGDRPATEEEVDEQLATFKRTLFMGLARPVDEWLATQRDTSEAAAAAGVTATEIYRTR
jgi:hypothetical protein